MGGGGGCRVLFLKKPDPQARAGASVESLMYKLTLVIIPTMVPTKTASRCQALAVTPAGAGMSQMMRPASTEKPRGLSFAPFHSAVVAAAFTTGAGVALAETTRLAEARCEAEA